MFQKEIHGPPLYNREQSNQRLHDNALHLFFRWRGHKRELGTPAKKRIISCAFTNDDIAVRGAHFFFLSFLPAPVRLALLCNSPPPVEFLLGVIHVRRAQHRRRPFDFEELFGNCYRNTGGRGFSIFFTLQTLEQEKSKRRRHYLQTAFCICYCLEF